MNPVQSRRFREPSQTNSADRSIPLRPVPLRRDALDPRRLSVVYRVGAFLYSSMDYLPDHLSHDARTAKPPLDARMVHMAARVCLRFRRLVRSKSQLSLADRTDELRFSGEVHHRMNDLLLTSEVPMRTSFLISSSYVLISVKNG